MSHTLQVKKGTTIIREGDTSDGFYILVSGKAEVTRGSHSLEIIDAPGTIFGELSQLLKKPRRTTVTAITDCELAHVTMNIEQLVASHPTIAIKLILTLARRLDHTTQLLTDPSPKK